ncbi:MAG: class I SAM-dependent methyltransferase [Proteobacteria bacterium]|nr:class I SAM-dependent methyltransferase [Pseudomonadota bacterium]
MQSPRIENGIVVGTGSNKYQSKNPVARFALSQLLDTVMQFTSSCSPSSILEVGCGEGHVTERLLAGTKANVQATELSDFLVNETALRLGEQPRLTISQLDIYDLEGEQYRSDVVVCCEVLEHLERPEEGLRRLAQATKGFVVLSVPREPNFRILNFLRGQHFTSFGNAPGHVQHWSARSFVRFLEPEFEVLQIKALLPWTVVLARPKATTSK